MSQQLWNALKASPVVLVGSFLLANTASANEKVAVELLHEERIAATNKQLTISVAAVTEQKLIEKAKVASATPTDISPTVEVVEEVKEIGEIGEIGEITETASNEETENDPMEQITNVNQLRDVAPGDWAYEALRSLVERYGCIAGYPDRTFRGNRATSRYEFAAGLNACLQQIERLIASSTANFVRRSDLETLAKLTKDFETEIKALGGRINPLENRVALLENRQFSTTTKLSGSADFGIIGAWGDKKAVPSGQTPTEDLKVSTIFPGRVGLNFDTSFTGKDFLRTKLEAGNYTSFNRAITGTDMTLYDFDTRTGPTGNSVVLSTLLYRFPIGDRSQVFIAPQGLGSPDVAPQLNPAAGGISRFGQRNPIYRLSDGAGVGVNLQLTNSLKASFTYLVDTGLISNPREKAGLFDGQFGALGQLTFSPDDRFGIAFTYVRFYTPEPGRGINVSGSTGSLFAQRPFGDDVATSANAFGIEANYRVSPRFNFGGWIGVTKAEAKSSSSLARKGDEAEIWNYAVAMGFPDFGRKGNILGVIFGMPPRARGNDILSRRDLDTSYRLEAFYRYKITDNISITPGFFAIFNPEHNKANDTIYVGTLLTTFSF